MDYGDKLRYSKKSRYPVNQLQMSRTDTTDYKGPRQEVGYGEGFADPHQGGYMGETETNSEQKKTPKAKKHFGGHGLGFPNY